MKIAFLTASTVRASARYRFLQFVPSLKARGWSVEPFELPKGFLKRYRLFRSLARFDLVFLQKKFFTALDWSVLRRNARKIVYDFDDAIMFRDPGRGKQYSFLRSKRFARTVKGADTVIAGNEYLEALAAYHSKKTVVIPTCIDMARYAAKGESPASPPGPLGPPSPAAGRLVTLGWIGSRSTLLYLERLRPVLDKVFERHPNTRLKIVCDTFIDFKSMPVEKKMWDYGTEIDDLHSFDIGLMPLTDDPWSRGKCGFKLLQYMAAGVPAVCSPVGVNAGIVGHGRNGLLAGSDDEWVENLSKLIEDPAFRAGLAAEARRTVIERYSLDVTAPRLASVLEATAGA